MKSSAVPTSARAAPSRSPGTPGTPMEKAWSLTLPQTSDPSNRRVVFSSAVHGDLDPLVFSSLIPFDLPERLISDLTVQVIRQAPSKLIPNVLRFLACTYNREVIQRRNKVTNNFEEITVIDDQLFRRVVSSEGKSVCGCVFKKGDIVWTCRNCAKDPTCVQCDPCFRKSNHKGHEVYFHRAGGGGSGCCDCGDHEAWSKQGNCTDHQPKSDDHDPSESFPEGLKQAFRAVVQGILTVATEYAVISTRGMEPLDKNILVKMMKEYQPTDNMIVRVHNDDIHTYDQVTQAFLRCGVDSMQARSLTEKVDKEGAAKLLIASPNSENLQKFHTFLRDNAGLIVSVIPEEVFELEDNIMVSLKWVFTMGNMSEGFRRLVSQAFLTEIASTATHEIPILDKPLYQRLRLCDTFENQEDSAAQFPSEITQVESIESLRLHLSGRCSVASSDLTHGEELNPTLMEAEFKERVRHPFNYCHRNFLSILSMASPFLSLPLKKWIHDVIMYFQHDRLFKMGFSQIITTIYPSLAILYTRHYGVSEDSIFRTTVQLYTAQSVVNLMSSSGSSGRILPEGNQRHLTITTMLGNTMYAMLADLGKVDMKTTKQISSKREQDFLNHHSMRTNRISLICRDFDYLTSNSLFATRMLLDEINPGTVESWIDVCRIVQEVDRHQRLTTHHVERDNDTWQYGANLAIEIEHVTTGLISGALLDPSLSSIENEFHSSEGSCKKDGVVETYSFGMLQKLRKTALEKVITKVLTALRDLYCTNLPEMDSAHDIGGSIITLTRPPFTVSKDAISIHIPLHRFYLKTFMYAAYGNVSCQDALAIVRSFPNIVKRVLFDWPLRCLSFNSQVSSQMWRRNGLAVANLSFNYNREPLSRAMRDLDLLAVQIAVLTNPTVDRVLLMIADRFEILQIIDTMEEPPSDALAEYRPIFVSEFLKTLIHVFTYLPVSLVDGTGKTTTQQFPVEGVTKAVRREVFHQILAGNRNLSSLAKVKSMIGQSNRTVSDQMLLDAVNELCQNRNNTEGGSGSGASGEDGAKFFLLDSSYRLFDPEYLNMASKVSLPCMDRVRDRLKALGNATANNNVGTPYEGNPYVPLISLDALPIPHRDFNEVRELLVKNARFIEILNRCMKLSWNQSTTSSGFNRSSIMSRVIHLITLQLHYHTLNPQSFQLESIYMMDNLSGWGLLEHLGTAWQKEVFKDDLLYHQGLGFVLHQIAQLSRQVPTIDALLRRYGFSTSMGESVEDEKKRRRKEAQAKALAAAKHRAAEAMKMFGAEMSDEEEEEQSTVPPKLTSMIHETGQKSTTVDGTIVAGSETKKSKSLETCIVCHEKAKEGDAVGYLCCIQTSNVLKSTVLTQTHWTNSLSKVCRVVALDGCDVRADPTDSSSSIGFIPYNENVVVQERRDSWMKISIPHTGWIKLYRYRKTPQPTNGSNSTAKRSVHITNVLHPVNDLLFNKNGGTRIHVSTCGHAMHFGCWDLVYATACSQSVNGGRNDYAIDVSKGEILCPLCKSMSNVILPLENTKLNKNELLGFEQDSDNEESDFPTENPPATMTVTEIIGSYGEMTPIHSWYKNCLRKYRVKKPIRLRDERFHANLLGFQSELFIESSDLKSIKGVKAHEIDDWFHGNMRALRSFFGTSSAIAYTILNMTNRNLRSCAFIAADQTSSTPNAAASSADNAVAVVGSWSTGNMETTLCQQLLGLVSRMSSMFCKDIAMYHRMLVSPILSLLLGKDYTVSPSVSTKAIERNDPNLVSQWRHLLRTLPFQAVHSIDFPDLPTVLEVIQTARKTFEGDSNDVDELFSSELWGFSHSPLLTQDLSVFVIILYGLLEDVAAYKSSLLIILIAKICQLLLEPEATGLETQACNLAPDSTEMQKKRPKLQGSSTLSPQLSTLGKHLRQLQQQLCRDANTPLVDYKEGDEYELVLYVCDSLIPFLDYYCRLYDLLGFPLNNQAIESARQVLVQPDQDDLVLVESVFHFMRGVLFPDMLALVDSGLANYLGQIWANDLKSYYPKRPSDQEVKWAPETTVSSVPDADLIVHSGGEDDENHGVFADALEDSIHHFHDAVEGDDDNHMDDEDEDLPELEDTDDDNEEDEEGLMEGMVNNPPHTLQQLLDRVRAMLSRAQDGIQPIDANEINPVLAQIFEDLGPNAVQTLLTQPNAQVTTADPEAIPTSSINAANASNPEVDWKQYGVLPLNGTIDELKYHEYKTLATLLPHFHTPLQGSITGSYPVLALNGSPLPYTFPDLSHRTLSYRQMMQNCLVSLPNLYTDLYHSAKFPEGPDGVTIEDPAVCLVCGTVLNAGQKGAKGSESARNPGECTIHAERCGAGVGVFYLLHTCQVLLMRNARPIYYPSIYLDETGESNQSGYQNKPMYLSQKRYRKLEELYISHQVGKEVARKRGSSDSVIRQFWF